MPTRLHSRRQHRRIKRSARTRARNGTHKSTSDVRHTGIRRRKSVGRRTANRRSNRALRRIGGVNPKFKTGDTLYSIHNSQTGNYNIRRGAIRANFSGGQNRVTVLTDGSLQKIYTLKFTHDDITDLPIWPIYHSEIQNLNPETTTKPEYDKDDASLYFGGKDPEDAVQVVEEGSFKGYVYEVEDTQTHTKYTAIEGLLFSTAENANALVKQLIDNGASRSYTYFKQLAEGPCG